MLYPISSVISVPLIVLDPGVSEKRVYLNHFLMTRFDNPYLYPVFIYGNFKRGQPLHHTLLGEVGRIVRFKSKGVTVDAYPLVAASRYNIPFLLNAKGIGKVSQ